MSTVSGAAPDIDFWEFVNCAVCHLDFAKDHGGTSSIPFWLTDCGHVVCNHHLNADQSCPYCASAGIQVTPLQRDLEPPMSNWFHPAPASMEAVAFCARMQMETMANLVRHYKRKYTQYRPLVDRLKGEHAENKHLKKLVADLQRENQHLKQQLDGINFDQLDALNAHGKRPRLVDEGYHSNSSPRSIPTPLGPDRLTLPAGHKQPPSNHLQAPPDGRPEQRPGTNLFAHKYSYNPPRTPHAAVMSMPILTHIQAAPTRRAHARDGAEPPGEPRLPQHPSNQFSANGSASLAATADPRRSNSALRMPPPPPPPAPRSTDNVPEAPQRISFRPPSTPPIPQSSSGIQRFVPQTPSGSQNTRAQPQDPQPQPQRFAPSTSSQRVAASTATNVSGTHGLPAPPSTHTRALSVVPSGSQRAALSWQR